VADPEPDSSLMKRLRPMPKLGSMYMKIKMTIKPPIHWLRARQRSMLYWTSPVRFMTVEPVVVNPLTDSKTASTTGRP